MTVEAAAGKNPTSHVGKLYNLLAMRIARSIAADCQGIDDASCIIVSQIGRAIDDPQVLDVDLVASAELRIRERSVRDIVHAELQRLRAIGDELLAERLPVH